MRELDTENVTFRAMGDQRSYRFKAHEPLQVGVTRVAWGRIDHAIDELDGKPTRSAEEAIHNARKDIKKLRALLRLVRGEIGDDTFRRENDAFRSAAAELAGTRDADVMVATLDDLDLDDAVAGPLRRALEAHRLSTTGGGREQAGARAVEMLSEARARVVDWPLERDSFEALEPGLRRMYRRGRREYRALREEPSVEGLHEWRKRAKELWYDHLLLEFVWEPVMTSVADQAHELSDRLGDDHDLALLLAWAREHAEAPPELVELVESRRLALQADAFDLGARLYADRPRVFIDRLERWWDASVAEQAEQSPVRTSSAAAG
jgi:CHAD domain-containing protein